MSNCIIITAYNAPHLLAIQLPAIRKYVQGVDVVILDNSEEKYRRKNLHAASDYHCQYREMKFSTTDSSRHHASALNWAVDNVLPSYSGVLFLDHDIVPFRQPRHFENVPPWFGVHQVNNGREYIHPGFMYYWAHDFPLNFMPAPGLDTGGRMHHFSEYMKFCPVSGYKGFEIYDYSWLHMTKGSNWDKADDYANRLQRFKDALNELQNK